MKSRTAKTYRTKRKNNGFSFLLSAFYFLFSLSLAEPIAKVVFLGNKGIKSKLLSQIIVSQKKKEFHSGLLEEDVSSLLEFYRNEGYFSAAIQGEVRREKKGVVVTFRILEGERSRIDSILFLGKKEPKVTELLKKYGYGFYSQGRVKKLEEEIERLYQNSGYYYADLKIDTLLFVGNRVNLVLRMVEGPVCYLWEIRFRGLHRIRDKDALRTTELKKGERYSQKRIYEAVRKLYATNLFENIYFKVNPLTYGAESGDSVLVSQLEVRFDCQELKERIFGFGLGYSSPPARTYHSINWQHLNLLRKRHHLNLLVEVNPDWKGSYRLLVNATYRVPFISWTKINFSSRPFLILDVDQKAGKRIWEIGEETGFYYDLTSNLQANITNKYRRLWGEKESRVEITNSLALNLLSDTRDDFFSPTSGFYSFSLGEYAGGLLGGSNDFYRLSWEGRIFFGGKSVWGGRFSVGKIIPYGRTKEIPNYEKFYLGGMTTLRGYDERAFGGNGFWLMNLENRFPIYKILTGVVFFDIGSIEGLEYDTGIGLRLLTPVGPLRVDYAIAPKRLKEKNWWKINLGLGNVF